MTLGMAWVRTMGRTNELVVASDSRLSGGQFWDSNPKIVLLPRSDCVMSFAGSTNDAYPLMLQTYNAISMYPRGTNRVLDVIHYLVCLFSRPTHNNNLFAAGNRPLLGLKSGH